MAPEKICRVEIVTEPPGLLLPAVTGFTMPIQVVRLGVTLAGESRSHVVVRSFARPGQLPPDAALAKLFTGDIVTCVRDDASAAMTLSCNVTDEALLFAAAAAAATIKRSWGWDESPAISISFVSGETFVVDPVFDGQSWNVTQRDRPAPAT